MKTIKLLFITALLIITNACSSSGSASSTCNDIVCGGGSGWYGPGTYTIYRGTLNPDTCGTTELQVNQATFNFYQSKWQANTEGYCCWEGLK